MKKVNCKDCSQADCAYFGMDNKTNCMDFTQKTNTTQRQWVGLTDEQKRYLVANWFTEGWAIKAAHGMLDDYDTLLREKNGDAA